MTARAAVVGVAMTPVVRNEERTAREVSFRIVQDALADAGLRKDDIDGVVVTPPWFSATPHFMHGAHIHEYLGLRTRNLCMVENGGHSASNAFKYALDGVLSGRNRVALALGVELRQEEDLSDPEVFFHNVALLQMALHGPYAAPYGLGAPIPYYAMAAQRYLHEFGLKPEDASQLAVLLRKHACKNPQAMYRTPTSLEEVLGSPVLSPPIRLLDATPFASGAAAVIISREEDARKLKKPPVIVRGFGEYHHPSHFIAPRESMTTYEPTVQASRQAFETAGLAQKDVDVAEVHGVFTYTELVIYEDLGFFPKGKAAHAVREGKTDFGGEIVMNPSGGRISLGYPAACAPLQMVTEIVRQLRGECQDRQVKNAQIGLVHAEHGMLNGGQVFIFERQ